MNAIERLGWTLLHFLWQGALIVAVYAVVRSRLFHPNARYIAACAALAIMTIAPIATFGALHGTEASYVVPGHENRSGDVTPTTAVLTMIEVAKANALSRQPLSWVVAIWIAGSFAFWIRLIGGWMIASRMRSMFVRPAPTEWGLALRRLGSRIGISRPVRLLVSALVEGPMVVGWLRPVVLVPIGALAGLPLEQMEALLLHELAHIRRYDYLVNMLQSVAEALLFYHPAVWWVSGHMRAERELCCDDIAVSISGDALNYARALAQLESARPAHLHNAIAANGGSLADRIGRLLGVPRQKTQTLSGPVVMVSAILLAIAASTLFAQTARPKFEVAAIKPAPDAYTMFVRPQAGGRLTATAPVMLLMQNAYTLFPFQIVGGPDWIKSERYQIDAKAEGNPSREDLLVMLQPLLEERFQLKFHRETKELPIYALVPAKGGPKLPASTQRGCPDATEAPPATPTAAAPCGHIRIMMEASGGRLQGANIAMAELVRILGTVMGRPVVDRTGNSGTFDVSLDFMPDLATAGLPSRPGSADATPSASDPGIPNIIVALQEKLGLKLESSKAPTEILVIDHVERPSGN